MIAVVGFLEHLGSLYIPLYHTSGFKISSCDFSVYSQVTSTLSMCVCISDFFLSVLALEQEIVTMMLARIKLIVSRFSLFKNSTKAWRDNSSVKG